MFERHGLSVIPVPAPSKWHDGKKPGIPWREFQKRLPTRSEMSYWFTGKTPNYAVITGKLSGIVVVDIDDRKALRWLRFNLVKTPWIVKTSKGWHCYYRYPAGHEIGNRARVSGMQIDVRGEGGFVIGPGSRHASGFVYKGVGNWRIRRDSVPVLDPSILEAAAPKPAESHLVRPSAPTVDRARAYLKRVPTPIVGHGSDHATFVAACRLVRGFKLPADNAIALLKEWAPTFDVWWLRRKVSTATSHGKEPHGNLL